MNVTRRCVVLCVVSTCLLLMAERATAATIGFAINPAFAGGGSPAADALPTLHDLVGWQVSPGGIFSGGSPPTQNDIGLRWLFNDEAPGNLKVLDFDFAATPVRSSWDYGLGDIIDFNLMFAPFFAEFPNAELAWAWHTAGGAAPGPSLLSVTTTPDTLPRTLLPFDTMGDFVQFDTVITGSPNIGDGIVGWTISGTVVPEPTSLAMAATGLLGLIAVGWFCRSN